MECVYSGRHRDDLVPPAEPGSEPRPEPIAEGSGIGEGPSSESTPSAADVAALNALAALSSEILDCATLLDVGEVSVESVSCAQTLVSLQQGGHS